MCEMRTVTITPSSMTPKEPSWQEDGTQGSPQECKTSSKLWQAFSNEGNVQPSCHKTQQSMQELRRRHTVTLQFMQEIPQLFEEDCTFQQQIKNAKKIRHKDTMKNNSNTHAKTNSALLSTPLTPEGRTQPHKWVLMHCQMTGEVGNGLVPGSGEGRWH